MVIPTVESLSEIIAKLKELQTTIANIEDKPLEYSEREDADENFLNIRKLVRLAGGHSPWLSDTEKKEAFITEQPPEWFFLNQNQAVCQVLNKLPSLSKSKLKKLCDEDIPNLLADDSVPKVKKQVWGGESPFTNEAQNLHYIREAIDKQIEKNIEVAKAARWQKHVRPLIDEAERFLFPFWDYLKEYGSYGCAEKVVLMEIIGQGSLLSLPEVIREFERIKYKLEVESQQASPKQPAETEQKTTPAKIINIGNFKGVLGDVQAENVQTGDHASIHKQTITAERKRRIIKKILKIIGAIVGFLVALLGIIYYLWWLWTTLWKK